MKKELIRILIKGGVLSPSELKQIIHLIESSDLDYFHFGSRQDILFPKTEKLEKLKAQFSQFKLEELVKKKHQNIVCSYVAADIFPSTPWLTGTTYLYVLEQFHYKPSLEINICDPQQRLVPLFTGNLNFIASPHDGYWYLYLQLPDYEKSDYYPVLIHTWDIVTIAQSIEELQDEANRIDDLFHLISNSVDTNNRTFDQGLSIPFYPFPYYEGMNRMGLDQYWLGLYWRDNKYNLKFLKALCDLCLACKVGKICITPWKSLVVKGIPAKHKITWEKFLGKNGINIRHSSLELNWHLPVDDSEAYALKRFMVRNFDQNDISTYGLTFSVSSYYGKNFTSVVIVKNPQPNIVGDFLIRPTYNVLYSQNFDPNTRIYKTYAQDVDKIELPSLLMELSQLYFDQLGESTNLISHVAEEKKVSASVKMELYQCVACWTQYDSSYGDPAQGIEPKTPFAQLPEHYCCPTCEAPLSSFKKKKQQEELTQT